MGMPFRSKSNLDDERVIHLLSNELGGVNVECAVVGVIKMQIAASNCQQLLLGLVPRLTERGGLPRLTTKSVVVVGRGDVLAQARPPCASNF